MRIAFIYFLNLALFASTMRAFSGSPYVEKYYFNSLAATRVTAEQGLTVFASGPVSIKVEDSKGRIMSRAKREIISGQYVRGDFSSFPGDGIVDDALTINKSPPNEVYKIWILPLPEARPDDLFVFEVYVKGYITGKGKETRISEIPTEPYLAEIKNLPPKISGDPKNVYLAGVEESTSLGIRDFDGNDHGTLHLLEGPKGMTLIPKPNNPRFYNLTWKPSLDDLGEHKMTLVAKDEDGGITKKKTDILVILQDPEWKSVKSKDGKVFLKWKPVEGAVSYKLYTVQRGMLDPVAEGLTKTEYVDSEVKVGERYEYSVYAVDRTGRKSATSAFFTVQVVQ